MRLFALLNLQDVFGYLLPTLVFMVVFAAGLGYTHFAGKNAKERMEAIANRFPDDITDRHSPFPLFMVFMLLGSFIWGFLYILFHGLLGVKI